MPEKTQFTLSIPIDASGAEGFDPNVPIKVVAKDSEGKLYSKSVTLDRTGKGEVKMDFDKNPGSLVVKLGPNNATDQEIQQLDTLELNISARSWKAGEMIRRPVLTIPHDYVELLWHWCRSFKIKGKLICKNGRPVPGATVQAFDVDFFWWWRSYQQVGTAVTDINGNFEITFRWCCFWYPWIWWRLRDWSIEPELVKQIKPILATRAIPLPIPQSQPDFSIFEKVLGERIPSIPTPKVSPMVPDTSMIPSALPSTTQLKPAFDPSILINLGEKLRSNLPQTETFQQLNIWPWVRFFPWRDCTPDIIFRATQPDGAIENLILNETYLDTRWNIPSTLNVTLVANDKAICSPTREPVPGNCLKLLSVCLIPISNIGGNIGNLVLNLNGYRDPGGNTNYSDQPFAGTMSFIGEFGDDTDADYYELQWNSVSKLPTEDWKPVPSDAISGFYRIYWGPEIPAVAGPKAIRSAYFPIEVIDGKMVIKTRQYFEDQNNFQDGIIRWWMDPVETLALWRTPDSFANGTYYLRFKTYKKVGDHLVETAPIILNQCGTEENNYICLTTDNRIVTSGPTDSLGHACGTGTVHTCTDEPEAYILSIKQLGSDEHLKGNILPCSQNTVLPNDLIQIDFIAYDPAGHLSYYEMEVTWGLNHASYPLSYIHSLNPLSPSPVPGIPPADYKGPDYHSALTQGATHPTWKGGTLRLIVRAGDIFPESCCYQLRLKAHKRTIVDCDNDLEGQTNTTIYTFTINYAPLPIVIPPLRPITPNVPPNIIE